MTAVLFVQELFGEMRRYDTERNGEEKNEDVNRNGRLQKNKDDEREKGTESTGCKRDVTDKAECCDVFKDEVEAHLVKIIHKLF